MRIGEVVIFGTSNPEIENFIRAICEKILHRDDSFCVGNLPINEELTLYLYGMTLQKDLTKISWDLFSSKVLGYIVLFDWFQDEAANQVENLLNFLKKISDIPLIMVGTVNGQDYPLPESIFNGGIPLTMNEKLLFCRTSEPVTCRKAVISLLDIVLDQVS